MPCSAQMSLEEKIGQLNQYSSTLDLTGPAPTQGAQKLMFDQVRQGLVGSLLNVTGAAATRKAQKLAVEDSRLGIPLMFGRDVIHGYRTIFPIPLGRARASIRTWSSARRRGRPRSRRGGHRLDLRPDGRHR